MGMTNNKSVVLIILDGWGLSPSWGGNALVMNNPKNIDRLWRSYPHTILQALGAIEYGNVVGESRLGHLMLGAGREISGYHSQINEQIKSHKFYKNRVILNAIAHAKKNNSNIHLLGMISDGGVHSDVDHLIALLELVRRENFPRVFIDAITDGVDSGPTEALSFIAKIREKIRSCGVGEFSSICGREYAMDRDEHWDRIRRYFDVLSSTNGKVYQSAEQAISENYRQNFTDEHIEPGLIKTTKGLTPIKNNDAVIFFNIREDRSKELSEVIIQPNFRQIFWHPKRFKNLFFSTFILYDKHIPAQIVFYRPLYPDTLSELISRSNIRQLKLAESEKRSHVTIFFNGGREEPFAGEEVKIISSPNVESYDQKPEMAAYRLTKTACNAIKSKKYGFILINYANVDMIAHTGNIVAVGRAVQILDEEVNKVVEENSKRGGVTIITADHGNAEQMVSLKDNPHERETLHTLNPVPFILISSDRKKNLLETSLATSANALSKILSAQDSLASVAPTILELMNLAKPSSMSAHSILDKLE